MNVQGALSGPLPSSIDEVTQYSLPLHPEQYALPVLEPWTPPPPLRHRESLLLCHKPHGGVATPCQVLLPTLAQEDAPGRIRDVYCGGRAQI